MALCENVAGCNRTATNSVPMFMGSVWLCPRCSVEYGLEFPTVELPWVAPDAAEWERIDREVWGLI